VVVADERALDDPEDLDRETTAQNGLYALPRQDGRGLQRVAVTSTRALHEYASG
jgi:hypothetical protein